MKLRERLQKAKSRLFNHILRLPAEIVDDVLDLSEEIQKAKQGGFTEHEIDVLCDELASILKKVKTFKEEVL